MERIMRLRGPATVVVLVALGLHLVVVLVSAAASPADPGRLAPDLAYALVDPVLLLLLTALVIACWVAPPVDHARGLTVAALALTVVTLVGVAVFAVLAVVRASPGVWSAYLFRALSSAVVGILTLGALIALLRRPAAPASLPELEPAEPEPEPEPVDPQQQPTWTSDAAVGTVWRRAGDAGSERPATSWDAPATGGGWGPDPDADGPAETTRRTTD